MKLAGYFSLVAGVLVPCTLGARAKRDGASADLNCTPTEADADFFSSIVLQVSKQYGLKGISVN